MDSVEALYRGILLGLVLFVSAGPIFFAVIETSIRKGFWYAFSISVGTLCSDALYIALAFFGLAPLFENETFKMWMGIVGGAVLIGFGISQLLKKPDLHAADLHLKKQSSYVTYMFKGFIINTLNPFVIFFWIGVISWASVHVSDVPVNQIIFFGATLATVFSTDMFKAFVAGKIKHLLSANVFMWVNRVVGAVMIYFGIEMMWKVAIGKI